MRRFLRSDSALAPTEWGLIASMTALGIIAVVMLWGPQIAAWFVDLTHKITSW